MYIRDKPSGLERLGNLLDDIQRHVPDAHLMQQEDLDGLYETREEIVSSVPYVNAILDRLSEYKRLLERREPDDDKIATIESMRRNVFNSVLREIMNHSDADATTYMQKYVIGGIVGEKERKSSNVPEGYMAMSRLVVIPVSDGTGMLRLAATGGRDFSAIEVATGKSALLDTREPGKVYKLELVDNRSLPKSGKDLDEVRQKYKDLPRSNFKYIPLIEGDLHHPEIAILQSAVQVVTDEELDKIMFAEYKRQVGSVVKRAKEAASWSVDLSIKSLEEAKKYLEKIGHPGLSERFVQDTRKEAHRNRIKRSLSYAREWAEKGHVIQEEELEQTIRDLYHGDVKRYVKDNESTSVVNVALMDAEIHAGEIGEIIDPEIRRNIMETAHMNNVEYSFSMAEKKLTRAQESAELRRQDPFNWGYGQLRDGSSPNIHDNLRSANEFINEALASANKSGMEVGNKRVDKLRQEIEKLGE